MDSATLLLTLWALGQPPAVTPQAWPPQGTIAAPGGLATGAPAQRRNQVTAALLLADALDPRHHAERQGTWLSLAECLTTTADRAGQRALVEEYWQLAAALARRHYRAADERFYAELAARYGDVASGVATPAGPPPPPLSPAEQAALASARALSRAALREADMLLAEAQQALGERLGLVNRPPPLPVDRPHAGVYETRFELIYATLPAPPRAGLLHRTLPQGLRAIDARAKAIVALADAAAAAEEAVLAGRDDLALLATLRERLTAERIALVDDVERYNRHIAEYVALVAVPGTDPVDYMSMHIRPRRTSAGRPSTGWPTGEPSATSATDGTTSAPDGTTSLLDVSPRSEWRGASEHPGSAGSDGVPLDEPVERTEYRQPLGRVPRGQVTVPAISAPRSNVPPVTAPAARGSLGSLAPRPVRPAVRFPRFESTARAEAPLRTQQLAAALSGGSSQPPAAARQLELGECLRQAWIGNRPAAITAYWECSRAVAQYQALVHREAVLAEIEPRLARSPAGAAAAEALVYERALRLAAEAEVDAAAVEVELAQFELARELAAAGANLASAGGSLWPSTPLHGGRYWLALESQPEWVARSPQVVHLARRIETLHDLLVDEGQALIEFDRRLAALWPTASDDTRQLRLLFQALDRETALVSRFVADLAHYNQAMADYAFRVMPPQSSWEELATALALPRGATGTGRL